VALFRGFRGRTPIKAASVSGDWRIRVDFAESQRSPGKHPIGLIVVIVMHVVLGYALVSGLAKRVVDVALKAVDTKIIEEVKPPPPPPPENLPPPPKNLPPPPAFVPPPEVQVAQQPTNAPTISTTWPRRRRRCALRRQRLQPHRRRHAWCRARPSSTSRPAASLTIRPQHNAQRPPARRAFASLSMAKAM
jgi:hypothetical protein